MRTSPPGERPHRNHGLFSDHYLDATLPGRPGWRELAGEANLVMEEIANVLSSHVPSGNEAQTESDLVRPVLRALGHDFEVQPALDTPDGTKRPATSGAATKNSPSPRGRPGRNPPDSSVGSRIS